jgi:hypothetical protein
MLEAIAQADDELGQGAGSATRFGVGGGGFIASADSGDGGDAYITPSPLPRPDAGSRLSRSVHPGPNEYVLDEDDYVLDNTGLAGATEAHASQTGEYLSIGSVGTVRRSTGQGAAGDATVVVDGVLDDTGVPSSTRPAGCVASKADHSSDGSSSACRTPDNKYVNPIPLAAPGAAKKQTHKQTAWRRPADRGGSAASGGAGSGAHGGTAAAIVRCKQCQAKIQVCVCSPEDARLRVASRSKPTKASKAKAGIATASGVDIAATRPARGSAQPNPRSEHI